MTVQSLPFVPPAPTVRPSNLPVWRLLWNVTRSSLSIWPEYAFDTLYVRNSVMGLKTLVVSDPEGVRHGPPARRLRAFFVAEGADWRRQRRLLAPTFTPGSIGLFLPHFRDAGLHLLHSAERSPRAGVRHGYLRHLVAVNEPQLEVSK